MDLPLVNKFLFCLPLPVSLITWGFVQLIVTIIIGGLSIIEFLHRPFTALRFFLFAVSILYSGFEAISCVFLIRGVKEQNPNYLEVFYNYIRIKVPSYALVLVVSSLSLLSSHSHLWFSANLDSCRAYLLQENPAVGALDWLTQLYLLLLVRSMMVGQNHQMDFNSLYNRLYKTKDNLTKNMIQEAKTEKLENIDNVY